MELSVKLTFVQRQWINFLADRAGRTLYRFGVTEADLCNGPSQGRDKTEREALKEQKEIADQHIRKLSEGVYALITITKLEIPGPTGQDHEIVFTDIGRKVAAHVRGH